MAQTVKEFFEEIEDRNEVISLGGGSCFIFCGTADEWDSYGKKLNDTRLEKLKENLKSAKKSLEIAKKKPEKAKKDYLRAAKDLEKFKPFMNRKIINDYYSVTGKHCVIFEGDEMGWFWTRKEFEKYMKTGEFPKDQKEKKQ